MINKISPVTFIYKSKSKKKNKKRDLIKEKNEQLKRNNKKQKNSIWIEKWKKTN